MYARRLKVNVILDGQERACPLDWLDRFAMRDFTRESAFDDTLPVGEGELEASFRVDIARLATALADWLRERGLSHSQRVEVRIRELGPASARPVDLGRQTS